VSGRFAAIVPAGHIAHRRVLIGAHLERLAQGHDPYGHLLAIERLARAARAEWTPLLDAASSRQRH
jgi:hypothetical protein